MLINISNFIKFYISPVGYACSLGGVARGNREAGLPFPISGYFGLPFIRVEARYGVWGQNRASPVMRSSRRFWPL